MDRCWSLFISLQFPSGLVSAYPGRAGSSSFHLQPFLTGTSWYRAVPSPITLLGLFLDTSYLDSCLLRNRHDWTWGTLHLRLSILPRSFNLVSMLSCIFLHLGFVTFSLQFLRFLHLIFASLKTNLGSFFLPSVLGRGPGCRPGSACITSSSRTPVYQANCPLFLTDDCDSDLQCSPNKVVFIVVPTLDIPVYFPTVCWTNHPHFIHCPSLGVHTGRYVRKEEVATVKSTTRS